MYRCPGLVSCTLSARGGSIVACPPHSIRSRTVPFAYVRLRSRTHPSRSRAASGGKVKSLRRREDPTLAPSVGSIRERRRGRGRVARAARLSTGSRAGRDGRALSGRRLEEPRVVGLRDPPALLHGKRRSLRRHVLDAARARRLGRFFSLRVHLRRLSLLCVDSFFKFRVQTCSRRDGSLEPCDADEGSSVRPRLRHVQRRHRVFTSDGRRGLRSRAKGSHLLLERHEPVRDRLPLHRTRSSLSLHRRGDDILRIGPLPPPPRRRRLQLRFA